MRFTLQQLARALPAGEFSVVPDSAHLAMLERPSLFTDTVGEFLDSRLGQSAQ